MLPAHDTLGADPHTIVDIRITSPSFVIFEYPPDETCLLPKNPFPGARFGAMNAVTGWPLFTLPQEATGYRACDCRAPSGHAVWPPGNCLSSLPVSAGLAGPRIYLGGNRFGGSIPRLLVDPSWGPTRTSQISLAADGPQFPYRRPVQTRPLSYVVKIMVQLDRTTNGCLVPLSAWRKLNVCPTVGCDRTSVEAASVLALRATVKPSSSPCTKKHPASIMTRRLHETLI